MRINEHSERTSSNGAVTTFNQAGEPSERSRRRVFWLILLGGLLVLLCSVMLPKKTYQRNTVGFQRTLRPAFPGGLAQGFHYCRMRSPAEDPRYDFWIVHFQTSSNLYTLRLTRDNEP